MTAVLIVSYLATGLAGVSHVHANQPHDHGSRTHVHFDWLARLFAAAAGSADGRDAQHGDHHEHGHHHHDHHHNSDGGRGHLHETPVEPSLPAQGGHDHDATCVYFADDALVVAPFGSVTDLAQVISQLAILDVAAESGNTSMLFRPERAHAPPDSLIAGCALILKLRTLRI